MIFIRNLTLHYQSVLLSEKFLIEKNIKKIQELLRVLNLVLSKKPY